MPDCIFCKIVHKEIPAHIVFENEAFLAFLDLHPRSPVHVQVIPKVHPRFVWDVENIGAYFEIVQTIAKALQRAFGEETIHSQIRGDEVQHAHVWVYPDPEKLQGDAKDLIGNAEKLRAALS